MSVVKTISRIFKAWGKDKSSDNLMNNYWTYISDALNGPWGTSVNGNVTVHHIGRVCFWKTNMFIASSTSITLDIPVQSNVAYAVNVYNITTGLVSAKKVSANSNSITISITSGQEYQIVSTLFAEKGV